MSPSYSQTPEVIFQDEDVLVVYKPSGLDVFPSKRGRKTSLLTWLGEKFPDLYEVGDPTNPAIVHRLDRYTSGLVLVACNDRCYGLLRDAFNRKKIVKEYIVLVEGKIYDEMNIQASLGARYRRSKKVSVEKSTKSLRGVRSASSWVTPLGSGFDLTLCVVRTSSGLRHQVRAHLGFVGHPVANDVLYGAKRYFDMLGSRFFLHASRVSFQCSGENAYQNFVCPLSLDLYQMCRKFGLEDCIPNELR